MILSSCVRRSLAALLLCSTLACYSYVPLEGPRREADGRGELETGDEIRVRVGTIEGRQEREDPLFANRDSDTARTLDGRVLRVEAKRIVLAVRRPERRGLERFGSRVDTLSVPFERVELIEKQRFSFWQSAAIAGATAAGLYLVFAGLLESGGGNGNVDDGLDPI